MSRYSKCRELNTKLMGNKNKFYSITITSIISYCHQEGIDPDRKLTLHYAALKSGKLQGEPTIKIAPKSSQSPSG